MALRRDTWKVIWGLIIAVVVGIGLILIFIFVILGGGTSPAPQQTQAAPPATTSPAPVPSTPTPTITVTHTPPPPAVAPLPRGVATPVLIPDGGNPIGYTAGDMRFDYNAPAYTVTVPSAVVHEHWGFTYHFQCDASTDDAWREAYPNQGSFSVKLGSHYLVRGSAYNGSGHVNVWSDYGQISHQLVISGPCAYELDYYNFPN